MTTEKKEKAVKFQKTWRTKKVLVVKGLPKDLKYRWVNKNKIDEKVNEGWRVLEKKGVTEDIAAKVKVGFDDSESTSNRFTYRGQTLMICHEDLMKAKHTLLEKYNKAPFAGTKEKGAVKEASSQRNDELIALEDNSKYTDGKTDK